MMVDLDVVIALLENGIDEGSYERAHAATFIDDLEKYFKKDLSSEEFNGLREGLPFMKNKQLIALIVDILEVLDLRL